MRVEKCVDEILGFLVLYDVTRVLFHVQIHILTEKSPVNNWPTCDCRTSEVGYRTGMPGTGIDLTNSESEAACGQKNRYVAPWALRRGMFRFLRRNLFVFISLSVQ
jgi:hypothetical protein